VLGVDALWNAAKVIDLETAWYRSVRLLVIDAVSVRAATAAIGDTAVAVRVARTYPNPAIAYVTRPEPQVADAPPPIVTQQVPKRLALDLPVRESLVLAGGVFAAQPQPQ
jgi:hypothetical protein